MRITLLLILLSFFSFVNAQNKIKPSKLIEDFDFLIDELRLQHQGLYNYLDKEQTDLVIDSLRNTLNVSHTKLAFYEKLRFVIGLTNEGHTEVELPKWTMTKVGLSKSFFPLAVKFTQEGLVLTQNYGKTVDGLNKGMRLISVNDQRVDAILERIYPLIPTDGFNETSKNEWVGDLNFSLLYRLVYGKNNDFKIEVQEFGSDEILVFTVPAVRYTKFKSKNTKFNSNEFDYNSFSLEKVNDSIVYLSVPSFGHAKVDYEKFYEMCFRKIDSLKTKHLILDIQANGGGSEGNENLLFSYLTDDVIQKYKQVTMFPKSYLKRKNEESLIEDKWEMHDSIAKRGEFTLYSDYYSDLGYQKPEKDLVYKGELYVLISGATFSGGAEFVSLVKMIKRGIFIGEETGGAFEGNVSGYSVYVKLPHTKIEVDIPIVHFQVDVKPEKRGRGIMPDYYIPQSWENYLNGINAKKEFAVKLITEKQTNQ